MLVFSPTDFDADGRVHQCAVTRECALIKPSFPVTPDLVYQLYLLAQQQEVLPTNEIRGGKYIELQVGRSVEHKLGFSFTF